MVNGTKPKAGPLHAYESATVFPLVVKKLIVTLIPMKGNFHAMWRTFRPKSRSRKSNQGEVSIPVKKHLLAWRFSDLPPKLGYRHITNLTPTATSKDQI